MTAEELIEKAAACQDCGKRHYYHWIGAGQASWRGTDGYAYRPRVDDYVISLLTYLATGELPVDGTWQNPAGVKQ